MVLTWDVALVNFLEFFVGSLLSSVMATLIFMGILVNWQQKTLSALLSVVLTMIVMCVLYLAYILTRMYIL